MKKNCIYKYITKNHPEKDIVVYEYGNSQQYLIHHMGNSCYETYDMVEKRPASNLERDVIWCMTNILCEYDQDGCIFLQVKWGK